MKFWICDEYGEMWIVTVKDEKDIKTKRMIVSLSSKIHNLSYYIESAEERQYRYDRQLEGAKCPY